MSADSNTFVGVILDKFNGFAYGLFSVTAIIVANVSAVHVKIFDDLVVKGFKRSFMGLLLILLS